MGDQIKITGQNKNSFYLVMKRKILFYGDSNTYGFDPRDYFGGRYDANKIWTSILAGYLGDDWKVINEGMNGRQLPKGPHDMKYIEYVLKDILPDDIFTFMLGTNDILMTLEPDADIPLTRMESLLEKLLADRAHPVILVIAPPHIGSSDIKDPLYRKYYQESRKMNAGFKKLAEKYKVLFTDASEWGIETAYDGVHFSEEGHKTFADNLFDVLKKLSICCKTSSALNVNAAHTDRRM